MQDIGLEVAPTCHGCLQVGEVGELSEIFQWRGDSVANGLAGFSSDDKRHVGEELSDVRPLLPTLLTVHSVVVDAHHCILPEQCAASIAAITLCIASFHGSLWSSLATVLCKTAAQFRLAASAALPVAVGIAGMADCHNKPGQYCNMYASLCILCIIHSFGFAGAAVPDTLG